jgi:hypothetical protein
MGAITFDNLPGIVADMNRKLDILLSEKSFKYQEQDADHLMTMEDLREYLPEKPARQTVYDWVLKRKIPKEKYSKRLYFRKSAIDKWLANGRRL